MEYYVRQVPTSTSPAPSTVGNSTTNFYPVDLWAPTVLLASVTIPRGETPGDPISLKFREDLVSRMSLWTRACLPAEHEGCASEDAGAQVSHALNDWSSAGGVIIRGLGHENARTKGLIHS